ncbi:hypothetical protein ACFWVP_21570 [Streptomyces sp. NPDC058637]|uniref:hypothetical protein n=1 Tax=Streptomyces sp. NPDC058637 TaxID=3346569 RepID=UPI003648B5A8
MTTDDKDAMNATPSEGRTTTARNTVASAGMQAETRSGEVLSPAEAAKDSASDGVRAAGETTRRVGRAAASGLQSGQQAVTANAAKAASAATAAWTVVKDRKAVAAGAAAGVAGVVGAAFAIGRSTAKPPTGPLTRLARGRI